jgi:hypothetical protein
MLLCLLCSDVSDPDLDAIIESVHNCTPHISIPCRGRIFCGLDDLPGLHKLVANQGMRAAMAPCRNEALLCALQASPGRIDAYANADDVTTESLSEIDELGLTSEDIDRFRLFGLTTVAALRRLEERHLRVQLGYRATAVYKLLHEHDDGPLPLYVPPAEIICVQRFEQVEREPGVILLSAEHLTNNAIELLQGKQTWRIEVGIINARDEVIHARSRILREGISLLRPLLVHVHTLCRNILQHRHQWHGIRLRLTSLRNVEGEQMFLFSKQSRRSELVELLRPRYSHVMKRVEILDPWSIIPERYSRILSIGPSSNAHNGEST